MCSTCENPGKMIKFMANAKIHAFCEFRDFRLSLIMHPRITIEVLDQKS